MKTIKAVLELLNEIAAAEDATMQAYAAGNQWPKNVGVERTARGRKLTSLRPAMIEELVASGEFGRLEALAVAENIEATVKSLHGWSAPLASWHIAQKTIASEDKAIQDFGETFEDAVDACLPSYTASQDKLMGWVNLLSGTVKTPPSESIKAPRQKRITANTLMIEQIQKDPSAVGWSCAKWSRTIKRARSVIVDTRTWKNLTMAREKERAERATDRRRKARHHRSE